MNDPYLVLKQAGLQVTRQRLDVYQVLQELNTHVTVDDVIQALNRRGIRMTVATVYNILNFFESNGLIMKIGTAGEPVIFDVNTCSHIHICDKETRMVEDYDDQELLKLINSYIETHPIKGLELERVDLNLIGKHKKQA